MDWESVGFVGGGRVASIILGGLKKAGVMPENIVVSDPDQQVRDKLKKMFGNIETTIDNSSAASGSLVFIAVHPPAVKDVLQQICGSLKPYSIIVSLAPKLTIARLSTMLNGFDRIARMIPNAPSIIGKGYNPVYFSNAIRPDEKSKILEIFKTLGDCPEIEEEKLEAYAILTAMGPTYFWFQFLELLSLAKSFGLSSEQAREGLKKMLCGSIHTLLESGLSTSEVLDLIPVKPLAENEQIVKNIYRNKLEVLYNKLTERR